MHYQRQYGYIGGSIILLCAVVLFWQFGARVTQQNEAWPPEPIRMENFPFIVAQQQISTTEATTGTAITPTVETPLFGIFEAAFTHTGDYANPYTALTATAAFARPDGSIWTIPLFWDGETTWKLRLSPDLVGTWVYQLSSADPGLNHQIGSFRTVPSTNKGGITAMADYPYYLQYQDGTPMWLMGDTQWAAYVSNPAEEFDRTTLFDYLDVRAAQGYNYVHSMLFGVQLPLENEGGKFFTSLADERFNPGYFQEVDHRISYMNEKGITAGIVLAWGAHANSWLDFPSQAARHRYARYVAARYSAYNVTFIVAGEWSLGRLSSQLYRRLGEEIMQSDPHNRLRGIHPNSDGAQNRAYFQDHWMTFGEYQQYYGGLPSTTTKDATDASRDNLRTKLLQGRNRAKPVINSEYAYYLRDLNSDNEIDKANSHNRTAFRRSSWVIVMAGGHFVTGFGSTYFGGVRSPGPFTLETPHNDDGEADLITIKAFFQPLTWWTLEPQDDLIQGTGGGYRYLLADPGKTYVVYTAGTTTATITLAGSDATTYTVKRYDTRTGTYTDLPPQTGASTLTLTIPDTQDWVFLVQAAS